MLAMPQMRPVSSTIDPDDPQRRIVIYEGASSPRELLESCVIQAQAALKGLDATKPKDVEANQDDVEQSLRMSATEVAEKEKETLAKTKADQNAQLQEFW